MRMATSTRTDTAMHTVTEAPRPAGSMAQLRLLQLLSPNLPVGAFSYSQGLEWAVDAAWVHDVDSLQAWLMDLLQGQMQQQELPMLAQMYRACENQDIQALSDCSNELVAFRETSELRAEERNRARALTQVLISLSVPGAVEHKAVLQGSQHAGFAWACCSWDISMPDCLQGFAWSWLENTVLAAIKTVPLGQSDGQRVLFSISEALPDVVQRALEVPSEDIGYASAAVAFASSAHETLYTRLYRS